MFNQVASQFCEEQPSSNVLLTDFGPGGVPGTQDSYEMTVQANSAGSSWENCQVNASGGAPRQYRDSDSKENFF